MYHIHDWRPDDWRSKSAPHQPVYPDAAALSGVLEELRSRPPLVTAGEIENLKLQLAEAAAGKRFLLQGGDCAESFADCRPDVIASKLKILLQVSVVLLHGLRRPVIRVGRVAGQYAKPRSAETETRDGVTLPSYRGDLVNRPEFTLDARTPDASRLLEGHDRSAQTLNYIRALLDGGFADLEHPENWDLGFARHSPLEEEYRAIVSGITDSLRFSTQLAGVAAPGTVAAEFFTSHEALHLEYEASQTHWDAQRARWYLCSTHFPWIGMRTNDPDGAHVAFMRGVGNPIGIKVGPGFDLARLQRTLDALDPAGEPGRLAVIHRFGARSIEEELPRLLRGIRASGRMVLWSCDPMHGNTRTTSNGLKTRNFDDILSELRGAFSIHADAGIPLGGVHFELTGDDVTECVGGARGLDEKDLERAYRSQVDPRLNYEQALELAMSVAGRRPG